MIQQELVESVTKYCTDCADFVVPEMSETWCPMCGNECHDEDYLAELADERRDAARAGEWE